MNRHYYKCPYCLAIYVMDLTDMENATRSYQCGICGRKADWMGRVSEDQTHLEGEKEVCKCDARCTNASGPVCRCECHSKNHGKGIAAWTKLIVVKDIPTLICDNEKVTMKHKIIKDQLDSKTNHIKELVDMLTIPDKYDHKLRMYSWACDNFAKLQAHKVRMLKLTTIEEELEEIKEAKNG